MKKFLITARETVLIDYMVVAEDEQEAKTIVYENQIDPMVDTTQQEKIEILSIKEV